MSKESDMLEELRKIRELLTPVPEPEKPKNLAAEFLLSLTFKKLLFLMFYTP